MIISFFAKALTIFSVFYSFEDVKTYTTDQNGAMVYVTSAATNLVGQVIGVSVEGLYVFDGVLNA